MSGNLTTSEKYNTIQPEIFSVAKIALKLLRSPQVRSEVKKSLGIDQHLWNSRENLVRENCLLLTLCLEQHQCLVA